jgi:hypothetical protein
MRCRTQKCSYEYTSVIKYYPTNLISHTLANVKSQFAVRASSAASRIDRARADGYGANQYEREAKKYNITDTTEISLTSQVKSEGVRLRFK